MQSGGTARRIALVVMDDEGVKLNLIKEDVMIENGRIFFEVTWRGYTLHVIDEVVHDECNSGLEANMPSGRTGEISTTSMSMSRD